MKTPEELASLKERLEALRSELMTLTEEELLIVTGGTLDPNLPGSHLFDGPNIHQRPGQHFPNIKPDDGQ